MTTTRNYLEASPETKLLKNLNMQGRVSLTLRNCLQGHELCENRFIK